VQNLLEQIKGVVGVSGAIIYDRNMDEARMLMPASFDEKFRDSLRMKFLDILSFVDGPAKFRIKLSRGWLIIKATETYAVLIVAKDDLNIPTLDLVLKSILIALDNRAYSEPDQKEAVFTEESAFTLLKAINLIVQHFTESISQFQLAQMLRQAKEDLVGQYADLKHFTVEHNATVILIKGSESRLDSYSTEAVAAWMSQFKKYVKQQTVVAGFNLKNITGEVRRDLEGLRFYRKFQQFASSQ
jgi:hypothetical protein